MQDVIPVPAVNAVIIQDGKVLVTKRSQKVREPGVWCLPGGHLDAGESWAQAIRREIQEEVGLIVISEILLGVYSDPALTTTADITFSGKRHQYVSACFIVKEFTGDIQINDEVEVWEWCHPDELPSPMIKSHPIRVQDAFDFKGTAFVR